MDTEQLVACLIDGGLVSMLKAGKSVPTIVWIVPDNAASSGFRLLFDRSEQPEGNAMGGKIIPTNSLQDGKLVKPSKEEVTKFLMDSFGLAKRQAEHVLIEAHVAQRASSPCG
jgi:hypothetical protein